MPSKLDDSENLCFLHACLECSDYSRIDYTRVASRFGIQAPAARMRFARLNAALGGKCKTRKRQNHSDREGRKVKHEKEGLELGVPREDDDDDENIVVASVKREDFGVRVKAEDGEGDDGGEDEMPLMKERYRHEQQQQRGLPIFAPQQMFGPPLPMHQTQPYPDFQCGQGYGPSFMPLPSNPMRMQSQTSMRVPTPLRALTHMQQHNQHQPAQRQPGHHQQAQQHQAPPASPVFQAPYFGPPPEFQSPSEKCRWGGDVEMRMGKRLSGTGCEVEVESKMGTIERTLGLFVRA
jgi:hypothetical protein